MGAADGVTAAEVATATALVGTGAGVVVVGAGLAVFTAALVVVAAGVDFAAGAAVEDDALPQADSARATSEAVTRGTGA